MGDAFDRFTPQQRGLFGDNEQADRREPRGKAIEGKSDLLDLTLTLQLDHPGKKAIAVSDPAGKNPDKWIWLPRSLIEYRPLERNAVEVTLPQWLAAKNGLI